MNLRTIINFTIKQKFVILHLKIHIILTNFYGKHSNKKNNYANTVIKK